jgi:hypothetical protein
MILTPWTTVCFDAPKYKFPYKRLLQGDVERGIGLKSETGSYEEDGGRIGIRAKVKSSPAVLVARAGGRERPDAGG